MMIAAILQQLKNTNQIANIPTIYKAVENNIMTNLSFKQICSLSLVALHMDMSQLAPIPWKEKRSLMPPGTIGASM